MNAVKKQIPLIFFILTFMLTLPTYILVGLVSNNVFLEPDRAVFFIFLGALAPIGAALNLTFREDGKVGVKKLLKRSFDLNRITNKKWFIPIILLMPLIFTIAYAILVLTGQSIPASQFPLLAAPFIFLLYFIMGLGEEVGWMGYVFDPLQDKLGIFKATMVLGTIWAIWHIPFYIFIVGDLIPCLLLLFCLFGTRIILVWLYNNTNHSVFGAICFHAMYNVSISVSPNYSFNSGITLTCISILIAAAIIAITGSIRTRNTMLQN